MTTQTGVTHRYLTATGSALQDPRHVVTVIDDQGNRSSWACAACPNRGAHAYYEYAHKMAQGHAAQCTALIEEPADGTDDASSLSNTVLGLIAFPALALALVILASLANWLL